MTHGLWLLLCGMLAACTDLGIVGRNCPTGHCDPGVGGSSGSVAPLLDAGALQPDAAPGTPMTSSGPSGPPPSDAGMCDPASSGCMRCAIDVDCADNLFYPVCDLASATCVECPDSAQETELRLRVILNCLSLVAPACVLFPVDAKNTACWTETCGNRCVP